jgi:site-specific DNA recombinase
MKRVIGYVRVSKDPKGDKLSPDIQKSEIAKYCLAKKFDLVDYIVDDNVKGSSFNRPGWKELMFRLPMVDGVVVVALDRFGRNLEESLRWGRKIQEQGKEIISVHENVSISGEGGFGDNIHYLTLLFCSEIFLQMHSQKMKDMQDYKRDKGEWRGGVLPLGYTMKMVDGKRVVQVDPVGSEIVKRMFEMRAEGMAYTAISDAFTVEGCRGRAGGKLWAQSIHVLLQNPAYVGKRIVDGKEYPVDLPRFLDEDLWQKVQDGFRPKCPNGTYLLSGMLHCAKCGAVLNRQKKYGDREGEADWVCGNLLRGGCSGVTIREAVALKTLDDAFGDAVNGAWGTWSTEEKRQAIQMFTREIIVHPRKRGTKRLELVRRA